MAPFDRGTRMQLEQQMRPGAASTHGFLGESESLEEVLAADAAELARMGVSKEAIADKLLAVLAQAVEARSLRTSLSLLRKGVPIRADGTFDFRGVRGQHEAVRSRLLGEAEALVGSPMTRAEGDDREWAETSTGHRVRFTQYRGVQVCPYGCGTGDAGPDWPETLGVYRRLLSADPLVCVEAHGWFTRWASIDFEIVDPVSAAAVEGPGLIREHGFFEGRQSPYRVEPMQLAKALRL